MKKIVTAYSLNPDPHAAVNEVKSAFRDSHPFVLIFFASSEYHLASLGQQLCQAFDLSEVFGCTTSGEIISGHMLKKSLVVMGLPKDIIDDIKVSVLENIGQTQDVTNNFQEFSDHFNQPAKMMDPAKFIGLILADGLSVAEEKVIDKIGNATDVLFVGGSTGDDLKFEKTYVFANGRVYTNAAILALIKPAVEFDVLKTQSFIDLKKRLVATKVDETQRQVLEFNHQPAVQAYCEALGIPLHAAAGKFMSNPVGLMIDNEPYVRSPQQVKGDSIQFFCSILEGMELTLLETTDIVKDTKAALDKKIAAMGSVSGIINFHCILRTLQLETTGQTQAYADLFKAIPTIGFSTYGELYLGHINQTSTMLLFK